MDIHAQAGKKCGRPGQLSVQTGLHPCFPFEILHCHHAATRHAPPLTSPTIYTKASPLLTLRTPRGAGLRASSCWAAGSPAYSGIAWWGVGARLNVRDQQGRCGRVNHVCRHACMAPRLPGQSHTPSIMAQASRPTQQERPISLQTHHQELARAPASSAGRSCGPISGFLPRAGAPPPGTRPGP